MELHNSAYYMNVSQCLYSLQRASTHVSGVKVTWLNFEHVGRSKIVPTDATTRIATAVALTWHHTTHNAVVDSATPFADCAVKGCANYYFFTLDGEITLDLVQRLRRDMAERQVVPLRIHNVSLHGRGKSNHGTLRLEKHHLTFTFSHEEGSGSRTPSARTAPLTTKESSALSDDSSLSRFDAQPPRSSGVAGDAQVTAKTGGPRRKPKTIWIPYPMINHCVLRPSNAQSATTRLHANSTATDDFSNEGIDPDGWPSTHGTSRLSTESTLVAPQSYSSPRRPRSPVLPAIGTISESGRQPAIRIRCRDFQMMALHFHPSSSGPSPDEDARRVFFELRDRCCVKTTEALLAYQFQPPQEETESSLPAYDARKEYARMGIGGKQAVGPGLAWRVSDINLDYSFSETYPSVLCVPRAVSDNMLKYGGVFRSRQRIPCLSYLHHNGGSITRSSQPKVGPFGKRNPQDEKLVTAIMSSHTPAADPLQPSPSQTPSLTSNSTATLVSEISDATSADPDTSGCGVNVNDLVERELDLQKIEPSSKPRIYGSMRRNFIMDARPKTNATVNKAAGGGFEDINNYSTTDTPIEQIFLNIGNIHVMRSSLQQIIDSFAHSDYLALPPSQEALRKSAWLSKHIFGVLEGANKVARAVGLTGSHTLVHCSDGWDRTAQVSALAQIMLDPHYRTFGGFRTLVQKDFLSFGHKFRDRTGLLGSEKWFEIENERIAPSQSEDEPDGSGINNFGQKAISNTKSWIDKTRVSLFSKRDASRESLADTVSNVPPNSVLHSPVNTAAKDDRKEKTKVDEISPVFHQFLDAVWQLQRQHPSAFEFNERFLSRLLYQSYAGQYGEFLFNNERERAHGAAKLPSVWAYFAARKPEFTNPAYDVKPGDALLLPKWTEPEKQVDVRELRWWSSLFRRDDNEMNGAPTFPPPPPIDPPSSEEHEAAVPPLLRSSNLPMRSGHPATAGPIPAEDHTSVQPELPALVTPGVPSSGDATTDEFDARTARPPPQRRDTSFVVLPGSNREPTSVNGSNDVEANVRPLQSGGEDGGDPLGVSSSVPARMGGGGGLDFAAFAQQAAFRER